MEVNTEKCYGCNTPVERGMHYCPKCGAFIDWGEHNDGGINNVMEEKTR